MNKCKRLLCLLLTLATVLSICAVGFTASAADVEVLEVSAATPTAANDFTWDNATVYFLLTDRFNNGNTSNDNSYGRGLTQSGSKASYDNVAAFQGGDFKGITQKINEGYFDDLGINAIWVAGWFEQVHGYAVGGDGKKSFPHFAYHGYYGLDFSELDKNFGTEAEFKEMIDTAHKHGIRIVLDVVLNHPGYNTMYDMNEYNFGTLKSGWQDVYYNYGSPNQDSYHGKIDYNGDSNAWGRWWGTNWIRAGLAGYQGGDGSDLKGEVNYLPDFRTESTNNVDIPQILKTKWNKEGTLNAKTNEVNQTISKYNLGGKTVSNYLVAWYAQWVEEYGIDGFRCDTAKHVEQASWKKLSDTCTKALENWRAANPNAVGADWDEDFWMTGENFGQGVDKNSYYQNGFDSMINFSFNNNSQGNDTSGMKKVQNNLNQTYADYANRLNNDPNFNVLTYISSHDTGLCRDDLYYQGSAFLLLPGGVQIFYGDETNRQYVDCSIHDHEMRSFMNWSSMDKNVLAHWQKVGSFRNNHVAVGAGSHANLSATSGTAFSRTYNKNGVNDTVVCVIAANKNTNTTITLNGAFADGTKVVNAYTGDEATVTGGKVTFNSGAQGTILVEADSVPVTNPTTQPTTAPVTKPSEVPTTPDKTEPNSQATQPTTTVVDPSESTPIDNTTTPDVNTTASQATVPTTNVITDAEYVMLGDADFSEKISIKDATLIQKHLAKIENLDEKAIFASDVDASGVLNIRDVTNIQKWLAKMKVEYAIGEQVLYKGTEGTTPDVTTAPNGGIIIPPAPTAPSTDATENPVTTTLATEPTDATVATEPSEVPTQTQPIITEPIHTNPVGGDTITLYYENTNGWGSVYWHGWNEAGGTNTAWPGDLMENVSGNIYKATVDASFTGIIFNDGSNNDANKTTNLTIPGDGQIYRNGSWSAYDPNNGGGGNDNPVVNPGDTITIYVEDTNNWGTVYWHGWNSAGGTNTAWPGDPMENVGGNIYKANVDASFTGIVFNNNNGAQTDNITIVGGDQIYNLATGSWSAYTGGGSSGGNSDNNNGGNTGGEGDYIYFTDNAGWGTVYCHTWNMVGSTNTPWPGDQMENIGGNQYRLLVDSTHTHLKFNGGNGGPESNEFELVLGNTYSN